jgi:hypothetical protein
MSDFSALDQHNWYVLASLAIQLAFLIVGVWFARNLLKTMRALQEQAGARLKLSITGTNTDGNLSTVSAKSPLSEQSPYWLEPETETPSLSQPAESGLSRFVAGQRKVLLWLQAPMNSAEAAPWRRIITWLQAPAGS